MAYNQVTPQEQQIAAYYNYMSADPSVAAQNPYGTYYGNYGQQQQPQPQLQQTNEWANQWYSQQHQQNYSAPTPRPRGGGGFRGRGRGGYGGDRGFKRPNPNIYNAPAVSYGSSYASTDAPSGVTLPATTIPSGPQPLPASSLKKPPLGKFYCDVCDCYCNDEHAFTLHVNGKKHMNSLRRAGKAPPAPGQHPSQFNQSTPVESKPAKAAKTSSSSTPSGNTGNTRDLTPPPPTAEDILINSKHAELTPVSTSAIAVASIVQATVTVLGTLTDIIEKVHLVGSYTKGVMLRGHTVADVSALLKERPTAAIRSELEQKISSAESLKGEANPSVRSEGGNIYVTDPNGVSVRIMLTWADAMQTTEASTDDISLESCQTALSAVHHAQWFTDRNISLNIRNCIRLMKFYKKSNEPWQSLNPWALEVLVEKTLSLTGTATIARSIRSIFEFISAGALLPGGYGLPDPCTDEESAGVKVDLAASLTPEQRDAITKNAQDTLRAIAFGRWEAVVGKVIKDELVNE